MVPTFNAVPGPGQFGTDNICGAGRQYNFQYSYLTITDRNKARDFLDMIPQGYYVTIRGTVGTANTPSGFASAWQADGANSLYTRLVSSGFINLDSFNRPRAFNFIYKKGDNGFIPASGVTVGIYDLVALTKDLKTPDTLGFITSPIFGKAKAWKTISNQFRKIARLKSIDHAKF